MISIPVPIPNHPYDILLGRGILDQLPDILRDRAPAPRYAVVTDTTVQSLYGTRVVDLLTTANLPTSLVAFPAGEAHKTRDSWARVTDELLRIPLGRDGVIVTVGGGVVGDLGGFVAATVNRGIRHVQVPTTLLAMIDASIGGKTGVDTAAGKNVVGAFHQPTAVVADIATLSTLDPAAVCAGMAEALKHGVVADAGYFELLEAGVAGVKSLAPEVLLEVIQGSMTIKASVVAGDEREAGRRAILNFGHTIGHAVESASEFAVAHPEAVAIGMVAEAHLAEALGVASDLSDRLETAVGAYGLPTDLPALETASVLDFVSRDKKVRAETVRMALPETIGSMARGAAGEWTVDVPKMTLKQFLDRSS